MSNPRIRIQSVVLALVLLPTGIGIVAAQASPTCQQLMRTYVTVPVSNRVSKATAMAWSKWRVGHPNWKPNPKIQRPKYVMTREEVVRKVDFACEVPTTPAALVSLLAPSDLNGPPPIVDLPPMNATQIAFPDLTPLEVAEVTPAEITPYTPANSWAPYTPFIPPIPNTPFIPPILSSGSPPTTGISVPPIVPPVTSLTPIAPEPSSLLLVASGLGAFLFFRRRCSEA
jgi:hypothetical protein